MLDRPGRCCWTGTLSELGAAEEVLPDQLSRRAEKKQKILMQKLREKGVEPIDYALLFSVRTSERVDDLATDVGSLQMSPASKLKNNGKVPPESLLARGCRGGLVTGSSYARFFRSSKKWCPTTAPSMTSS